jgi:hypothetical protein
MINPIALFSQNTTISNPFEESFNDSPLDFDISTSEVCLGDAYINNPGYTPSRDVKAIIKYDKWRNIDDWWVVGADYFVKTHKEFFGGIEQRIVDTFDPNDIATVKIKTKSARNGRWGLREYVFPNIGVPIVTTNGHETSISLRIIAWSGLDGKTANNYLLGAFDGYCTNGQVFTKAADKDTAVVKKYKRNTKGFDNDLFSVTLVDAADIFYTKSREYEQYAKQSLPPYRGIDFIESLGLSKKKENGLIYLYNIERDIRGANVFALHSAFTNYSSHVNKDLFRTIEKSTDIRDERMFKREEEVLTVLESNQWRDLTSLAA